MKLKIKVKAGARKTEVQKLDDGSYLVRVKARREKGNANKALVRALGEHFGVAPSSVQIVSGHASENKIVNIG